MNRSSLAAPLALLAGALLLAGCARHDHAAMHAMHHGGMQHSGMMGTAAPTTPCGQGPEVASIQGNQMRWYSFSGTAVKTNGWDISDAILAGTATYFGDEPNDGLVGRCSSHWGKVIRDDYPWNHLDQINQVLGTIGKDAPDPVAFYVQHANRLKWAGL